MNESKTRIIGLLGYARSGKDETCRMLQEIDPGVARYAFADALKEEVAAGFGVTPGYINEYKSCFRELLQAWGVTRREFNPDYWVEKVQLEIDGDHPRIAVLTDVRFLNEARMVRDRGGILVRVSRPGVGPANGHVSESELADFAVDWNIRNAGTLDDLRAEVRHLYEVVL